jgi:hypothetical protein
MMTPASVPRCGGVRVSTILPHHISYGLATHVRPGDRIAYNSSPSGIYSQMRIHLRAQFSETGSEKLPATFTRCL